MIPAYGLYDRAELVGSLEEARSRLAAPDFDPLEVALVEAEEGSLAGLSEDPDDACSFEVSAPFAVEAEHRASMRLRVHLDRPQLFVYQDHWLFDVHYRFAPDYEVLMQLADRRTVHLRATRADTGEELRTFHVNGFATGALLPAGSYELGPRVDGAPPGESRLGDGRAAPEPRPGNGRGERI